MEALNTYREALKQILVDYTLVPYAYGDIDCEAVFDSERDRYLLVITGWKQRRRIHGTLVHVDVINDKFYIQRDGTEAGIADELVAAGVPKDQIVLAFQPEERRTLAGFAPS